MSQAESILHADARGSVEICETRNNLIEKAIEEKSSESKISFNRRKKSRGNLCPMISSVFVNSFHILNGPSPPNQISLRSDSEKPELARDCRHPLRNLCENVAS